MVRRCLPLLQQRLIPWAADAPELGELQELGDSEKPTNDRRIDMVFNTTAGSQAISDSYSLRRETLMNKVPYFTTVAGCRATVQAIAAIRAGTLEVRSLQSYSA